LTAATVIAVVLLGTATAVAKAPQVLYAEPTEITSTSVVLQASVNPSDKATTYYFEYGTTGDYGNTTADSVLAKSKEWRAVSAGLDGLAPGSTYHYRIVARNGAGNKDVTFGSDRQFTTAPVADPEIEPPANPGDPLAEQPPPGEDSASSELRPALGTSVVVQASGGQVLVRRPGSSRFQPLDAGAELPMGTVVDATGAAIKLTSALPGGRLQSGRFGGGRFEVRQGRRGFIDLYLRGRTCRGASASVAAASRSRKRRLWGRDKAGRFRTHGRNSHATVRGTRWSVVDRCNGTLTRVSQGSVVVRDTVRHRRVVLRAGQRYLARNRRGQVFARP
jgi:hypothetical protein